MRRDMDGRELGNILVCECGFETEDMNEMDIVWQSTGETYTCMALVCPECNCSDFSFKDEEE